MGGTSPSSFSNHSMCAMGNSWTRTNHGSTSLQPPEPILVTAWTMNGNGFSAKVLAKDTVHKLKDELEKVSGIAKAQQKLTHHEHLLVNTSILEEVGISNGAELTLVIGPPVPKWAADLGLDGEHPARLRDFYTEHGLQTPAWMDSDSGIWDVLEQEQAALQKKGSKCSGWNNSVSLFQHGQAAAVLHSHGGAEVDVEVRGWVSNNKEDSCIHQVILACNTDMVADVYDGVPNKQKNLSTRFRIKVPSLPGNYMLWRAMDLQYSMADARRNFSNAHKKMKSDVYPGRFVGWLVVD